MKASPGQQAAAVDYQSGQVDGVDLQAAWIDFCDRLKRAGDLMLAEGVPAGALDRAAGYRLLARNIALALRLYYENCDPLNPELTRYFDPICKQSGDNQDALYLFAPINGTDRYRLSGRLGSASSISFSVKDDGPTPWGGRITAVLLGEDVVVEPDGSFELVVGPTPQESNWLRTSPNNFRLLIRQFFGDWETERPMQVRIDRISDATASAELTPRALADGLQRSAQWIQYSTAHFHDLMQRWQASPNQFITFDQIFGRVGSTPGGASATCYWELRPDEALVIRAYPPSDYYWSMEFGNYWWETMDYRYRLSGTNSHYAQLEADGELIVVISHDDPGVPNWLDPSGFSAGYITCRWMGDSHPAMPSCHPIKRCDLFDVLPPAVRRIDCEGRRAQIAARRRGACQRFPY